MKNPKTLPRIVLGIFQVVGLSLMGWATYMVVWQHYSLRTFEAVPAEIVSSELGVNNDSDGSTYFPEITFRYRVNNHRYASEQVFPFTKIYSSDYALAQRICRQNPVGAKVTAWYRPSHPEQAFLVHEVQTLPFYMVFFGFGFAGFATLIGLCFSNTLSRPIAKLQPLPRGGFSIPPSGSRFKKAILLLTLNVFWWGYWGGLLWDYYSLSNYQMNRFLIISSSIITVLGLVLLVFTFRGVLLFLGFYPPEVFTKQAHFVLGQPMNFYLVIGLKRALKIKSCSFGLEEKRINLMGNTYSKETGFTEKYPIAPTLLDLQSLNITATQEITLPLSAHASTGQEPTNQQIYWCVTVEIKAVGFPKLKYAYPILIERPAQLPAVTPGSETQNDPSVASSVV